MDFWFAALRGEEDSLVEARAVLGAPMASLETLELFAFETVDVRNTATWLSALVRIEQLAGGIVLSSGGADIARERALALACSAASGNIFVDEAARARLERELLFVRARARDGWRLPVGAVSLAPDPCDRASCRRNVAQLPWDPPFVGREDERARLLALLSTPGPVVLQAPPGSGAERLVFETALRAGRIVARIAPPRLRSEAALRGAIAESGGAWVYVDPVESAEGSVLAAVIASSPTTQRWVLRVDANASMPFVPDERTIALEPLGHNDLRAVCASLLGPDVGERIVRAIVRRAHGLPGRVVELARAAVQSGEVLWDGEAFHPRSVRLLGATGQSRDAVARRIEDVPARARRALSVLLTLGDGIREADGLAALRGTMSSFPRELVTDLEELRILRIRDGRLWVRRSTQSQIPERDEAARTLREKRILPRASEGEAHLASGRVRDAGSPFVEAAAMALEAGLQAAAVRYTAAAVPSDADVETLNEDLVQAVRTIAKVLGPAVVTEALVVHVPRSFDPATLDHAAEQFASRKDNEGAERMQALAEIVRGNAQKALQITGRHGSDASGKSQLIAAIAQASAGDVSTGVRTALAALAGARRGGDVAGEAAALAVLGSLYRTAGRDDDARMLGEHAHRLRGRHSTPPATEPT